VREECLVKVRDRVRVRVRLRRRVRCARSASIFAEDRHCEASERSTEKRCGLARGGG
jgi:hypothetical protein